MFPNNNPLLIEKLVNMKQEEIAHEIEAEKKLPRSRGRIEVFVIILLLVALIWFFL